MGFVLGTILAFMFLDPPWRYLVLIPLAGWELFEIWLWLGWRNVKSMTGADAFVGAAGTALTDCKPGGQVRVRGQIWTATCPEGVDRGATVVVEAIDGVKLKVRPA